MDTGGNAISFSNGSDFQRDVRIEMLIYLGYKSDFGFQEAADRPSGLSIIKQPETARYFSGVALLLS